MFNYFNFIYPCKLNAKMLINIKSTLDLINETLNQTYKLKSNGIFDTEGITNIGFLIFYLFQKYKKELENIKTEYDYNYYFIRSCENEDIKVFYAYNIIKSIKESIVDKLK